MIASLRLFICTACFFPLAGQPRSIFGVYGSLRSGHDSIRVTHKSNGKVGFRLELHFANGHTCRLSEDAEWRGDHLSVLANGLKESEPCKLEASFSGRRIALKDEGQRCAAVYCGTRGKLDGISLRKD